MLFFVLRIYPADGQSFELMRYDEKYQYLKDSTRSLYNTLKFLPLTKNRQVYLSFGGELRYEYVRFKNEDWGRLHLGDNNFLLQRYNLHMDLQLGERVRLFFQLRSALQDGRKNGPRPIDEDSLNIQNLFLDVIPWKNNKGFLLLRIGRQEIEYGSGRLVSVRDGPNVRLYFTGPKVTFNWSRLTVDAFVLMADTLKPGIFDNKPTRQINLWGSYGQWITPRSGNFEFFYLGIRRGLSRFEKATAPELRHTVGSRFWKAGTGFNYNLEAAYQFGRFGHDRVSAWAGYVDLGYYFQSWSVKPSFNLRTSVASGDGKIGDKRLGTFNPLYPKGGYFGFNPQIGGVNLIAVHPYLTLTLWRNLGMQADVVLNWRYSLQDGIYRPSGTFNLAGASSSKRYIGTGWLLSTFYPFNRFLSINTGIQYFKTGAFINDIIPVNKDGVFFNARIKCLF
jgi:hypothetical protein